MTTITEADVKEAALAWLTDLGWSVAHGPDIAADAVVAPDAPRTERDDYEQVVLERRLRDALERLNLVRWKLDTKVLDSIRDGGPRQESNRHRGPGGLKPPTPADQREKESLGS